MQKSFFVFNSKMISRDNNHEIQLTVSFVKYSWTLQGRVESNF